MPKGITFITKTVPFLGKVYTDYPQAGLPAGTIHLNQMSNSELVELYNLVSANMGRGRVQRFTSVEVGIKRTWKILQEYGADDAPEAGAEAPKGDAPAVTLTDTDKAQIKAEAGERKVKGAKPKADKPPKENKVGTMVDLLKRSQGATMDEMCSATGWQAHSVRAAISVQIRKKLGHQVSNETVDGRGRVYRIAA